MLAILLAAAITVDSNPVVGCMMTPQDAKYRPKILRDFVNSCAENATPSEWRPGSVTGGFVMTVTKDANGNLTGLSCDFPPPKADSKLWSLDEFLSRC